MTEELRTHLLRNVQTGCGSNPASYSIGIAGGGGIKRLGNEADLTASSVFLRMIGTIHGLPHVHKDFTISSYFQELSIDGMIIVTSIIKSDPKMVFNLSCLLA